ESCWPAQALEQAIRRAVLLLGFACIGRRRANLQASSNARSTDAWYLLRQGIHLESPNNLPSLRSRIRKNSEGQSEFLRIRLHHFLLTAFGLGPVGDSQQPSGCCPHRKLALPGRASSRQPRHRPWRGRNEAPGPPSSRPIGPPWTPSAWTCWSMLQWRSVLPGRVPPCSGRSESALLSCSPTA